MGSTSNMRLSVKFLANAYKFMPVPGILNGQPGTDDFGAAPDGWAYIYSQNIRSMANDGSPYITDGSQTLSLYQYQASLLPTPLPPTEFVTYRGLQVSYQGEPVTYREVTED